MDSSSTQNNRTTISVEQVIQWIDSFSRWGKWGNEDELGALNFITSEKKKRAFQEVKEGYSISLSRPIEFFSKSADTTYQATRFMLESGEGREHDDESCNSINGRRAVKEQISFVFHGYCITHLDAFSHLSWKGKMYNGRPANLVTIQNGATKNGIISLKNGILSRGILLDIAKLKNKKWLEFGEGFTKKDLEEAETKFNIKVESGDILLVRTGLYGRRLTEGPTDPTKDGSPGPDPSILQFVYEREVALFGSDTSNDIQPALYSQLKHPVHVVSLVALGVYLLDNANLEELSKACEERKRYSFLLQISPLLLEGTSGSPVNPIAIF